MQKIGNIDIELAHGGRWDGVLLSVPLWAEEVWALDDRPGLSNPMPSVLSYDGPIPNQPMGWQTRYVASARRCSTQACKGRDRLLFVYDHENDHHLKGRPVAS